MSIARRTVNLNEDVLRAIFSWLPTKSLFSAVRASRTCQVVGLPLLLARPFRASDNTLDFFYSFLTRTAPASFQHLRTLYLVVTYFRPPGVRERIRKILAILQASTSLTSLYIAPAVLAADPAIPTAVRSLNLRRLEIVGDDTSDEENPSFFDGAPNIAVPSSTFLEIPDTVEHLSFSNCTFRATKTYPQIKRYKCFPFPYPLFLGEMVHMLPNVQVLEMGIPSDIWLLAATNREYLVPVRQANLTFQQNHTTWRSLKYLRATSIALFSMALQCKVESLFLFSDLHHPDLGLVDMVPYFRPLGLQHLSIFSHFLTEELPPFFAAGALDGLQRFEVDIGVHESRPGTALVLLEAALVSTFAPGRNISLISDTGCAARCRPHQLSPHARLQRLPF